MPSIRTVVSDLYHNEVRGIGRGFQDMGRQTEKEFATVSAARHIEQKASPGKFSFNLTSSMAMVLDVTPAAPTDANGTVLFFDEHLSTEATITRARRIVGGSGYSGCMYSVYSCGNGTYKCYHTSRPLNPATNLGNDALLIDLRAYAATQNWVLIHEIPTAGLAGVGGCVTTCFVTRVSYTLNPVKVRTVRLALDRYGLSVRRDRWNDNG